MKQTINIHIDKLVDKIEINNPNETGSLHERIEEIIFDALTEAIFSPELKIQRLSLVYQLVKII